MEEGEQPGEQPREHLEPWKIRVRVSTTNERGGALAIETVVEVSLVIWVLISRSEFDNFATQFCFFLTSSRDFRAFKFTDGCSRGCVQWVRLFCKLRDYPLSFVFIFVKKT
jgi:hypothetical protein